MEHSKSDTIHTALTGVSLDVAVLND